MKFNGNAVLRFCLHTASFLVQTGLSSEDRHYVALMLTVTIWPFPDNVCRCLA